MRISFIEPHLKIFGGIRRILELSNRLTKLGHDVTIFHSDGSPCDWMECIANIKSYNDVLKQDHEVIIFNDPNPIDFNLVRKANAKLKIFYVLELYEKNLLKWFDLRVHLPWKRIMLVLKRSLNNADLILSNASWERDWLKQNLNLDSILLIGGINREMFHPVKVRKNNKEIRILCSGDPRERKGTKDIKKAIEIVKKSEPRVVLDTYSGKGISQDKMARVYSSADIFVEASYSAGWNNPVVEAMACKVPVVCTDIGGVRDFAFHERTALLTPVKNPLAIASAVLKLIRSEKLRNKLRENAYQQVLKFDWDDSALKLQKIIIAKLSKVNKNGKN